MNKIYSDGFTIKGNPSKIGGGYVLTNEFGERLHREDIKKWGFTNNEAELKGVLKATELAEVGSEIYTDSENTIRWIRNGYCKARPDLSHFAYDAQKNIAKKQLLLYYVPREENYAGIYIENYLYGK